MCIRDSAKSNDPETWADFDTAVAAATRLQLEGIGLCLSATDGLTGLDLDHVLDPVTGELEPLAAKLLKQFAGTYTEISPSGTGLRIWCFGQPQRSGKCVGKIKWLEVYSHPSNRYLTVTGNHWADSAATVTHQQSALDWLHQQFMVKDKTTGTEKERPLPVESSLDLDDTALLTKARQAKNGARFAMLWAGDTSHYNGDDSAADLALCNLLAFWTDNDSPRMDRLFRQSGLFRSKWDQLRGEQTYGALTVAMALAGNRNTYTGEQFKSQSTPTPSDPTTEAQQPTLELNPYRGSDDANASLFLKLHGKDLKYCSTWEKWLLWTSSHWQLDDNLDIFKWAADVPKSLYQDAANCNDSKTRRSFAELAHRLEAVSRRNAMLIASKHQVAIRHSELDTHSFLLNCANGTVNLKTGQLDPHQRRNLITHTTPVVYDPAATAPTWLQFLQGVFQGDHSLIQFIQKAVGYSLTGDVREQVLFICHGVGSNGKSVFLNILRKLLGSLALQAAPDLLMADKQRRHPTEQADLFGKRLVVCQETEENRRFNETLVKQLTGGEAVRARKMHEDFWEFNPTWKLWLSTNHRPEVRGTDHAIWRRIRLIKFNVKFYDPGEGEPIKDLTMEDRLTAELPGILTWAVTGCLTWQREHLQTPAAVKTATESYRQDMDVLAAFLTECCVTHRHCEASAADLYLAYTQWCERSGEFAEKQRKFGMRLTERGYERYSNNGTWYRGVGLKVTEGTEPTEP